MSPQSVTKKPSIMMSGWRSEEERRGSWGVKVCRDLLGIGKACKPHQCCKIKERLHRHQLLCHSAKPAENTKNTSSSSAKYVGISTSETNMLSKNPEGHSTQTKFNTKETDKQKHGEKRDQVHKEHNPTQSSSLIKLSEAHEILPRTNEYYGRLKSEIQEVFTDILGFPDTSEIAKQRTQLIINKFVDKVVELFMCINNEDYDDRVRYEIEKCLRNLQICRPEMELDKEEFKGRFCDSLFNCIKTFNEPWYGFRKNTKSEAKNLKTAYNVHINNLLENDIMNREGRNLRLSNKNDVVTNTLIKKVKPMLEPETNAKHVIKAEIINVLDELSQYLQYTKNKEAHLHKLTTNLINILNIKEGKNRLCDKYNWKPNTEFEDRNFVQILNNTKLSDKFKNETVNQITDILFGNLDTVLRENSVGVVKDIHRILKSSGEFSSSEASSLAKTLIANVKDCFNEALYTEMDNYKHSSSFTELTSEQELLEKNEQTFCYQSKSLDIIEGRISVWINEQPSNNYVVNDTSTRNRLMQELATNIHENMINNMPGDEIKDEIAHWLSKIVKPHMRGNVAELAENLKDTIIMLPQEEALSTVHQKIINRKKEVPINYVTPEQYNFKNIEDDTKFDEFIAKFIQRNYHIEDDELKDVFKLMLKLDIHKLSPSVREELYKNLTHDEFDTDKFRMELGIIEEICVWLKKIPFYSRLLQPRSERITFIYGLAKNITDIEIERVRLPNRMDYDTWLHTEIALYMLQKEKEISNEDKLKIDHYAEELCFRIVHLRKDEKKNNDLTKIITEYMKKYHSVLAKDYLKKILWHRRLSEDLMKMLHANPTASVADAEKRLVSIPIPRDESVLKFKIEIKYNIAIHDWLHTFPLIPPKDSHEELARNNMIKELLQKILEARDGHEDNLDNYIANWIANLNIDRTKAIDVPMKISQLRSVLDYIKWTEIQPQQSSMQGPINRSRRHSKSHEHRSSELGEQMVKTIEDWCNDLPIKENDEEATMAKKEQLATNIFQILGSLSDDPRMANDCEKFRETLAKEIDAQLQNLSDDAVSENKDSLKVILLDKIMAIKNMIRDITAGDEYVQVLEKSIDETFHDPHRSSNKNDSGYELFKKRMVMLWLLENYDYAVDFHSLKHKKILSEEIDFLLEEEKKRNVFPADRDKIMNDMISAFHRAAPPDEDSIIDEVENIKLRCEIETWAKELPLRETFGLKKVLERDQILTVLTRILFELERKQEPNAEEDMRTEIMKWAKKLPILPGEKNKLSGYADLLMCILKASVNSRKCQRQPEQVNLTIVKETLNNLKCNDEINGIRGTLSGRKGRQVNTSQVAGPSTSRSCGQECQMSKERLNKLITTAISNWCWQLPLQYNSPNEQNVVQGVKEFIFQRLINLVSELHYRPNTLNNEGLYEFYLNIEIEDILVQLTTDQIYWEAQRDRNNRKYQLINSLKSIRPLVQNERDRDSYKEQLKHTISSFHESMVPHSAVQLRPDTQMEILDDFLQYKSHKGDFENQELYKMKIRDALNNELNDQEVFIDPLLAANRLICAMSKVNPTYQRNTSQEAARRFSQPNPLISINLPAQRRRSLPHPLSRYAMPYPPEIGSHPPAPPRGISRSPLNRQQSTPQPYRLPTTDLSQDLSSFTTPEMRPFPLPRPQFSFTNDSNSSSQTPQPRFAEQRNLPPDFTAAEEPYQQPKNEPQNVYLRVPSGRTWGATRSTARVQNSSTECPEEQRNSRQGGQRRGITGTDDREYCETCVRDHDCSYKMPRPYPMPMDYMYHRNYNVFYFVC